MPASVLVTSPDTSAPSSNELLWGAIVLDDKTDISIKGNKSIVFQNRSLKGTKPGFTEGFSRQETLLLSVHGKAYGNEINVDISDSTSAAPEDRKTTLELKNRLFSFLFGEYRLSMNDNKFAAYNRTLDGVKVETTVASSTITFVNSVSKGTGKKDTFYGNNSQGPYPLVSSPVIVGSEVIRINDQKQVKGKDYDIDYLSGKISFLNKIVEPMDKVDVDYEYSSSIFKRSLNVLAFSTGKDEPIGFFWGRDADESTSQEASVNAVEHNVIGLNIKRKVFDGFTVDMHGAVSRYDPDIYMKNDEKNGIAAYSKLTGEQESFSADAEYLSRSEILASLDR